MHAMLLDATVKSVRQRIREGDCPTIKAFTVEWLEDAVDDLSKEIDRLKASPVSDAQVKQMVDRFLGWHLPANFSPDGGISFSPTVNAGTAYEHTYKPVGTNLFDATQAEAMVRFMLDGMVAD